MNYSKSSRILLVNTFLVTFSMFLFNPYLVVGVSENSSFSLNEISLFLMISLIAGSIVSLASSLIAKPQYYVVILCASPALCSVSFFIMSYSLTANNFSSFLISLILLRTCLTCSSIFTRTVHMITNIEKDCSRLFSSAVAIFGAGSAIAPLAAGLIYNVRGFQGVLMVSTFVMTINLALLLVFFRVMKKDIALVNFEKPKNPENSELNKVKILTLPFLFILIASVIFFMMLGQSLSYIPLKITQSGSLSWIPIFFTANAIILTFFSIYLCKIVNRIIRSESAKCAVGILLITVSLIITPYVVFHIYGVILIAFFYSLGEIIFSTFSLNLLKKMTPAINLSKVTSVYTFVTTSVGLGLGQYIGTILMNHDSNLITSFVWFTTCIMAIFILRKLKNEKGSNIISA